VTRPPRTYGAFVQNKLHPCRPFNKLCDGVNQCTCFGKTALGTYRHNKACAELVVESIICIDLKNFVHDCLLDIYTNTFPLEVVNRNHFCSVLDPLLFIIQTTPFSSLISDSYVKHHLYADGTQLCISFSALDFMLIVAHRRSSQDCHRQRLNMDVSKPLLSQAVLSQNISHPFLNYAFTNRDLRRIQNTLD